MKHLTIASALWLFAMPAFAFQCPTDIAAIGAALAAGTDLSDEGQQLHDAGDHQASVDTLAKAKDMLGLN